MYSKGIRHLGGVKLDDVSILQLRLEFPSLRSVNTLNGDSCTWTVDPHDHSVEAVYHIQGNACGELWDDLVSSRRPHLPDDWAVTFRSKGTDVTEDADTEKLLHIMRSQPVSIETLIMDRLSRDAGAQLRSELVDLSDNRRLRHVHVHMHCKSAPETPDGGSVSIGFKAIGELAKVTEAITMCGVFYRPERLMLEAQVLRAFGKVQVSCNPWATGKRPMPEIRHLDDRAIANPNVIALYELTLRLSFEPADLGTDSLSVALQRIQADKTWLRNLAQTALCIGGPTVRYSLMLCNNSPSEYPVTEDDRQRMCRDEIMYSDRLNDIINSYIESRRALRPAGWKRVGP